MFQFLSFPLQKGIRFLPIPIPAISTEIPYGFSCLIIGKTTGLLRSTCTTVNDLGSVCPPMVLHLRIVRLQSRYPDHLPFGGAC